MAFYLHLTLNESALCPDLCPLHLCPRLHQRATSDPRMPPNSFRGEAAEASGSYHEYVKVGVVRSVYCRLERFVQRLPLHVSDI